MWVNQAISLSVPGASSLMQKMANVCVIFLNMIVIITIINIRIHMPQDGNYLKNTFSQYTLSWAWKSHIKHIYVMKNIFHDSVARMNVDNTRGYEINNQRKYNNIIFTTMLTRFIKNINLRSNETGAKVTHLLHQYPKLILAIPILHCLAPVWCCSLLFFLTKINKMFNTGIITSFLRSKFLTFFLIISYGSFEQHSDIDSSWSTQTLDLLQKFEISVSTTLLI